MNEAGFVGNRADEEYSASDELVPHTSRDAQAPTLRRRPRKACIAACTACAAVALVLVMTLVLFSGDFWRIIERKIVLHNNDGGVLLCMDPGFTAAITEQLSEACTRLNLAGVQYWLDEGTLLSAIREQGVFKHDYDGDIAYVRGDHAKLVGALYNISAGTFYRQAHFDQGGVPIHGSRQPMLWDFMIDAYPFTEEAAPLHSAPASRAARTANEAGEAATRREEPHLAFECGTNSATAVCRCRRWSVFPLRSLNGSGPLAHCNIPNMPWLYYGQRNLPPHSSTAYWERLLEAALDRRDR